MTTSNPLEIIGVPQWVIAEALANDDLASITLVANVFYKGLSKLYHTDTVGPRADRMRQLGAAMAEIRNPDGLRVLAEWAVDPRAVDAARQAALVSRMHDRGENIATHLARALVNTDPLRVLQASGPVELFAAMIGPGGPTTGSYHQAVVAQATRSEFSAMISAPIEAEDDAALFDGQPRFVKSRGVWQDKAALGIGPRTGNPILKRLPIGRLRTVPGDIRLVGGVSSQVVTVSIWDAADLEEPVERRTALEAITDSLVPRGFEWTSLDTAWWMSDLERHVEPGGFLVLMNDQAPSPMFALAGPLLTTRPL